MLFRNAHKKRKGQGLVEYALIVATVALTSIVAIAVFGHKVADVIAIAAGMLPGAHAEDNQPIATEGVFELNKDGGAITLDSTNMVAPGGVDRWQGVFGQGGAEQFVAHDDED